MFKKLIRYRDAKCIEGKGERGGGIPLFSSPGDQKERYSFPSGVWVGALAENKNDFGAKAVWLSYLSDVKTNTRYNKGLSPVQFLNKNCHQTWYQKTGWCGQIWDSWQPYLHCYWLTCHTPAIAMMMTLRWLRISLQSWQYVAMIDVLWHNFRSSEFGINYLNIWRYPNFLMAQMSKEASM